MTTASMEWPRSNESQAQYQARLQMVAQYGTSRCDRDDLARASLEWHLTETQVQARRAKIDALIADSVNWPRMNESQIRSYRAVYGTSMNDMTNMPYMGAAAFKALSDAFLGPPPPLNGIQPGSGIGIPQGMTCGPLYRPFVRGPGYDERVIEIARGIRNRRNLNFANIALEFYEKCQDAEFEIVEPLYSEYVKLAIPKANPDIPPNVEEWCHVSFIARPKNCD